MSRSLLSARAFFRDPVAYMRTRAGDAEVVITAGPGRFALVRDPDAIWAVLVTDARSFRPGKWKRRARRVFGPTLNTLDGEEHRRRRMLLQPSFDRRRIVALGETIAARAEETQARLAHGAQIRLRDELDRYSLLAAADVLLSTDLQPHVDQLVEALRTVVAGVPRLIPAWRGTPHGRSLAEVGRRVDAILAERRLSPTGAGDLVDALLAGGLPGRTARGEVITFLIAAVDEPPSALEAAWWLLGLNPAAEQRFHAEIDAAVPGLPYVDAVLHETLRLFPPARHVDRCPVADTVIDGVRLRGGAHVLISPLVTHREPRLYERPDDFVPERWLEPRANRARGAYLPFGAGQHACIGEQLGRTIATAALVAVGRRWRLVVDDEAPPPGPRSPGVEVVAERR